MRLPAILSMMTATVVVVQSDRVSRLTRRRSNRQAKKIFDYWTPEQVASAVPRDFLIDPVTGERQLRTRSLQQTTVADADWTGRGAVNEAAGRILFTLNGGNYVCSGTVINDYGTVGRSLVATAAHCAYDEVANVHSTNVLFIPKQDDGGLDKSNRNCSDDFYGCWAMKLGVVDSRWRDGTWPSIIKHDYAIYVVPDEGGFFTPGYNNTNPVLDSVVKALEVDFTNEQGLVTGSWAHFMGYSYNRDPNFRHCFDALRWSSSSSSWELPGCSLAGGASGGPGLPNPADNGKMYSVVSWGYTSQAGMGGPSLHSNSFSCIFERARVADFAAGNAVLTYSGTPCPITSSPTTSPKTASPSKSPIFPPTSRPTKAPVPPPPTCSNFTGRRNCNRTAGCIWVGTWRSGICKYI